MRKTKKQNLKFFKNSVLCAFFCTMLVCCTLFASFGLAIKNCFLFDGISNAAVQNPTTDTQQADDLQNEGVIRPEDLSEGLSRKSFEDMERRRVTIREPYMEVTSRNVDRSVPGILGDTFQFVDPATGEFYQGEAQELAKIDFNLDGKTGNQIGDKQNPRYPMRGLNNSKDNNPQIFSNFEKYMLLRQAWYYRTKINTMLGNNQLKTFLKKHPAADGIYGEIDKTAKAVSKKIISDPIYNSPLTTGLYLAPGEVATVVISGIKEGEVVKLTTHQQDSLGYDGGFPDGFDPNKNPEYNGLSSTEKYFKYWDTVLIEEAKSAKAKGTKPNYNKFDFKLQGQWQWQNQKVPCMGSSFEFDHDGEYEIGSIYGGPLYLQPTSSVVNLTITGVVETPHFILGVTTKDEFDKYLKSAPGLIATLDVENGQLIGLSEYMKNCDDIEKLAYFWHSVFAINSSLNGRAYNYNITMAYDIHVPAGEAVALNSSFAAQPYGWFGTCMNYETLTTKGNWGTFHELGHIQAKTYGVNWGMCGSNCKTPCEGEVWNNTLIILAYSMLCNMDPRVIGVEHGEFVHPYTSVIESMNLPKVNDYHDYNNTNKAHFAQLSLYSTLIHSFGPERFIDFFYTYKVNPSYCANARADFIYRIGLVDHVNILDWINTNYHGNVNTYSDFTSEQLQFLNSLPTFYPIAYEWANGIDGNETARKYDVDGKFDTIFDLSKKSFASYKDFSIIEVTKPLYGEIEYDANEQKAIYTPPKQITENDQFDIVVSTLGGRIVTLNVRMRLVYNGAHVEVFKLNSDTPTSTPIENVIASQKDAQPFRTEESAIAGKASFTNSDKEYYHIQFSFKATKAGLHRFTARGDDGKIVYFKKDGQYITRGDGKIKYSGVNNNYFTPSDGSNHFAEATLEVGDVVDIDCHLINWGGNGFVNVGVIFPGQETVVDIPAENIVNTRVSASELERTKQFKGWQPQFMDSIKDASIDYVEQKDAWKVLKSPAAQPNDGEGESALIDGDTKTFFHSRYSPSKLPLPHEFVIDCAKNISVNYFDIVRRTNGNDRITELSLYAAPDNHQDGIPGDNEFKPLFVGAVENPNAGTYRIKFDEQEIRFFKLVVTKNDNQTVIRELSAGRAVDLGKTVKPKNFQKENSGFAENSSNGKLSTQTRGAYYVFEFLGSGFDVFADTDLNYGSALVYLDENKVGEINLADSQIFNKCVFRKRDLPLTNHTVKIVADTDKKFNISFINVDYSTPVDQADYPSSDFGDLSPLTFSTEWRTQVKNYKTLTNIDFVKTIPDNYVDTYVRINKHIFVYAHAQDKNKIAFVYPGKIVAPSDSSSLFAGCSALKQINFENFDTTNMLFATSMFSGCKSLTKLNLSTFNAKNLLYMGTLLQNCESLTELDLSSLTIKNSSQVSNMLKGCVSLNKLVAPNVLDNNIQLPFHYIDQQNNKRSILATKQNAGHTLILHEEHPNVKHVDYVPATRGSDGVVEHYECRDCGALLIDGKEVDQNAVVIRAKGYLDIIIPCVVVLVVAIGGALIMVKIRRKKKIK